MAKSKSKSKRTTVALISGASKHRRVTRKNTLNSPEPLVLKAYDPIARKHATYTEKTKVNLGRNEVKPRKG